MAFTDKKIDPRIVAIVTPLSRNTTQLNRASVVEDTVVEGTVTEAPTSTQATVKLDNGKTVSGNVGTRQLRVGDRVHVVGTRIF